MNERMNFQSNISSLLETSHLKPVLYNSVLSIAQFVALHRLRSIPVRNERSFHSYSSEIEGKKIIIHSVHGTYLSAIYKEGALAKALRLNGNNAKMLFCDQRLKSCCALFTLDHPASKHDCKNCVSFGKHFCDILDIPYLSYHDFCFKYDNVDQLMRIGLGSKSVDENSIYKGVHIGYHAKTGTERYFKGSQPDPGIYRKHFTSKLIDASIVVDIAEEVLRKEEPDMIITSHSCYSEFGPFSEFYKNIGIPVFTWFTGYEPDTIVFDLPEIGKNFEKYQMKRSLSSLCGYEGKELNDFLAKRKHGMGESRFYGFTLDKKELNFSDDFSKIYGLFPNAPWDADPSCSTLFFPSILDWVYETIEFFKKNPTLFLVIKTHPSERVYHSRVTVYDAIKYKYPELPCNILLLPPETSISAYDLFKSLTAGIVSNSTTGLEMLLEGIPVVAIGDAHYRGKGFTYDPKTKDEYFALLLNSTFLEPDQRTACLYAYYYFIKSFLPYHIFYKKNFLNIGFTFKSLEDLKGNQEMSHIIECITQGKLFQDW